ncbi:MAG: Crp/Fnr family transcriptional regulator [Hyphomicrobiales bacterium]|nr:Crp/Fnr family transcriptional regulator [Hyphomicrobiales bacterium]
MPQPPDQDDPPALRGLDPATRAAFLASSQRVRVPAGTVLFQPGAECANYLLVLDGSVRVQMVSEGGREIVLYRVETGETCVLTTSCLLAHETYTAEGVAETAVDALAVPAAVFRRLLADSESFRGFVFAAYGARITNLMMLVEAVAFGRVDLRLAKVLLSRGGGGGRLDITHQELAVELGTAREVVSRQMKEFERRGWVALGRGRVDVLAPDELRRLIDGTPV